MLATLVSAGCGSGHDAPAETPFPPVGRAAQGDVLVAAVDDPAGDAADPLADLRSARLEQRGTTLELRVALARPLSGTTGEAGAVQVGAYLLRGPDDSEPFAARLLTHGDRPPAFRWGPWLEPGVPASGRVAGREVTVTVRGVPPARYRYVQFFAESDRGVDVAPDEAADAPGVVALDPVGP